MAVTGKTIGLEDLTTSDPALWEITTAGAGPQGQLPLTDEMLRDRPSGDLFGLTQNAGMGWNPRELVAAAVPDPQHAGRHSRARRHADRAGLSHRPLGGRPARAGGGRGARRARAACRSPRYCSDPCDGRTQGTPGMFDSLPYRNDAADRACAG